MTLVYDFRYILYCTVLYVLYTVPSLLYCMYCTVPVQNCLQCSLEFELY